MQVSTTILREFIGMITISQVTILSVRPTGWPIKIVPCKIKEKCAMDFLFISATDSRVSIM